MPRHGRLGQGRIKIIMIRFFSLLQDLAYLSSTSIYCGGIDDENSEVASHLLHS